MSLSKCCATVFKHEGASSGKMTEVAGLKSYVAGTENGFEKVVVIVTDIFGPELINTQLRADQFAEELKAQVIVPDLFNGDPYAPEKGELAGWLEGHSVDGSRKLVREFLEKLTKETSPKEIFGVGYCYGAPAVLENLSEGGFFKLGAVAHPSFLNSQIVGKVVRPLLISTAPDDYLFTPELRTETTKILTENKVWFQMDLFEGVPHGYSVRGDISNPKVKYAMEKTFMDQIVWFQK